MIEWSEAFTAVGVIWAVAFIIWAVMKYPQITAKTGRTK